MVPVVGRGGAGGAVTHIGRIAMGNQDVTIEISRQSRHFPDILKIKVHQFLWKFDEIIGLSCRPRPIENPS